MTECNGCGRCCDPVVLPYTQDDIRRAWPGSINADDRRFVLEDLTPIKRREGLEQADYLSQGGKTFGIGLNDDAVVLFSSFYRCRNFDPETKRCAIYDRRPPLCREYPWYGEPPDRQKAIPPECSYNADVGVPVKLTAKPREDR